MIPSTQFDTNMRIVSLDNLDAMCKFVSGMCHRWHVAKTSANYAYVEYSNPDEWGAAHPMTAFFPIGRYAGQPAVLMTIEDVQRDNWHGEGWQAFQQLMDCPIMWRNPTTGQWEAEKSKDAAI